MNPYTGEIKDIGELSDFQKNTGTPAPFVNEERILRGKVKGHEKCPCGSKRQFKNCCKKRQPPTLKDK